VDALEEALKKLRDQLDKQEPPRKK
jgi:hypothetical protein